MMRVAPDYLTRADLLFRMVRALNSKLWIDLENPVACRHAYDAHDVFGFSETDHEEAVRQARIGRLLALRSRVPKRILEEAL